MSEQALRQIAHAVRYAPHMAREHNHQLVMGELADRLLAALAETPAQEHGREVIEKARRMLSAELDSGFVEPHARRIVQCVVEDIDAYLERTADREAPASPSETPAQEEEQELRTIVHNLMAMAHDTTNALTVFDRKTAANAAAQLDLMADRLSQAHASPGSAPQDSTSTLRRCACGTLNAPSLTECGLCGLPMAGSAPQEQT